MPRDSADAVLGLARRIDAAREESFARAGVVAIEIELMKGKWHPPGPSEEGV